MLLVAQILVVEEDHPVGEQRCPQRVACRRVERPGQVDAGDFGAEAQLQRRDVEQLACGSEVDVMGGHGSLSPSTILGGLLFFMAMSPASSLFASARTRRPDTL